MADETPYSNELRLPITIKLPAAPRLTPEGRPWPLDPRGRPWPSRRGRPVYPVTYLPHGMAPGTGHLPPQGDGRSMLERFAAMDAAMRKEGELAGARARRAPDAQQAADRRSDGASQSSGEPVLRRVDGRVGPSDLLHLVAEEPEEEREEEKAAEDRLLPHPPLGPPHISLDEKPVPGSTPPGIIGPPSLQQEGPKEEQSSLSLPNLAKPGEAILRDDRRRHILDGDGEGRGGHGPGRGTAGKSEFPSDWSDDKTTEAIQSVANDPASVRKPARDGRTSVTGVRAGVEIKVFIGRDGKTIVTAYPTNVARNRE